RSDRQYIADRLDSVLLTVLVDERHHHFARRSSSACAKYADALRRISLARRSSRFSRSSSLSRSRSWLVSPGRCPSSRWRWRIQPRNVSAEQPIFCATDWIAAHSDSYSCACSPTSRTARSRTSAEYCFALAMAPISQGLEPPANSGRFPLALFTGPVIPPHYRLFRIGSVGNRVGPHAFGNRANGRCGVDVRRVDKIEDLTTNAARDQFFTPREPQSGVHRLPHETELTTHLLRYSGVRLQPYLPASTAGRQIRTDAGHISAPPTSTTRSEEHT